MSQNIFYLVLIFVICSCSVVPVGAEGAQRFRIGSASICVAPELSVEEMKVSGALGTAIGADIRGVFITLPWLRESEGEKGEDIVIFVRPAGVFERELPGVDESQAQPVPGIPGLLALPVDEKLSAQRFIGGHTQSLIGAFSVMCRDLPIPQQCSRPFRYDGLVGAYSFNPKALQDWSMMDEAVASALRLKRIAVCRKQ